jgi:hypothetical protein
MGENPDRESGMGKIRIGDPGWGKIRIGDPRLKSRTIFHRISKRIICCGSGSGIRTLFEPGFRIWDGKIRIYDKIELPHYRA